MSAEKRIIDLFKTIYGGNDYSLGKYQEANPDQRQRFFFSGSMQRCPSINLGVSNGHYVFKKSWYSSAEEQKKAAKDFADSFDGYTGNSGATWFAIISNNQIEKAVSAYLIIAKPLS